MVRFRLTAPGVFVANVNFTSNGHVAVTGIAAGVSAIAPNSVDLASPPATFTITGNGFTNLGFGLPVANFARGTTLLAQARATALTGSTTLTVPFPTQATAITPSSIDLLHPPASFTITGNRFANLGFGLPVVNFVRGTTVLAQAPATALSGGTTLTVPYPTQATTNLPGLSAGQV